MTYDNRKTQRTSSVHGHNDVPTNSRRDLPLSAAVARKRRSRQASVTAAKWIAIGIGVPVLSFLVTIYVPKIPHLFSKPTLNTPTVSPSPIPSPTAAPVPPTVPDNTGPLPDGSANLANPNAPITIQTFTGPAPVTAIMGGTTGARRSLMRQGVDQFVKDAGATAGLNGTFFQNAKLTGTDNTLIGPSLSDNEDHLVPGPDDGKPVLIGRPLVLMSPTRTLIVPFDETTEDNEASMHSMLPDVKSAFLAGPWLVHDGVAADISGIAKFHLKDAMDPRRRAFFGLMPDGRPVLGATTYVATSAELAATLQNMGLKEAVLLDSGFSTSLVFQDKILVTGHTAPGIPSRPVPQAIVLYGQPADGTVQIAQAMIPSVARGLAADVVASHRHHHHPIT